MNFVKSRNKRNLPLVYKEIGNFILMRQPKKITLKGKNVMKFTDFADAIKAEYSKNFKDCCCKVKLFHCCGSSIFIDCYLARDSHDLSGGYFENDMFKTGFVIHLNGRFDSENELPENLVMESTCKEYATKPESRYVAFELKKVPYRKTSGDAKKLIKAFGKFTDRLYSSVMEDYKNGNTCKEFNPLIERLV